MTKQQSIIGITSYGRNDKECFTIPMHYIDSVRRAGGSPVLIPPGESRIGEIINRFDGFVLTGGGDIEPNRYQGNNHKTVYNIDAERDAAELDLADLILKNKTPTFAICRGMQIVNTVLGGTLHEHLPDVYGDRILHRNPPSKPTKHDVTLEENSVLQQILKKNRITTVSWHHQSINELGEGLSISARAEDGVIEAVEFKNEPWFIGVQWHPELSSASDPDNQMLFNAFLEATVSK